MRNSRHYLLAARLLAAAISGILAVAHCDAMEKPYPGPFFENDRLLMVLIPRTPEQMAAFYEARGFPKKAIDLITDTCFVTVHIENRSQQVTWLETANWRLDSDNQTLPVLGSDYWNSQWDKIELPQANRSTFFWTLLPARVDLRAAEPVGGNIVLPGNVRKFHIEANFMTGSDKGGKPLQINFESVECPRQVASP